MSGKRHIGERVISVTGHVSGIIIHNGYCVLYGHEYNYLVLVDNLVYGANEGDLI